TPSDCCGIGRLRPVLDEAPAEPALDAEVAAGDGVVERRGDAHDPAVLHVQVQGAPDAAVRADGAGDLLARLVPLARDAQLVLGPEHERAGGAHRDAVAAVDARRVGQRHGHLRRDPGIEAAPRHGNGERVLVIRATRLHAPVAEDALAVVPHVEVVVDLDRLVHVRGVVRVRRLVVPGYPAVPLAGRGRRRRRTVAAGITAVLL